MTSEAVLERPAAARSEQAEPDVYVSCELIDEGFNYRRRYDPKKMADLRADMKQRLRTLESGRFQLIVGGRRFRGFREEFGIDAEIRARARKMSDAEAMGLMMAENGQREDPSVIEDAEGAARMLGFCKGDRAEAAARLGWEPSKLNRRLALMNAVPAVRDAYLTRDDFGVGHVEVLAALRKEVQERVMEVLLKQEKVPTVDQLKAMAEASLQNLDTAIFDKTDCAGCQYNTGEQQALFDVSFAGSRCTNKECFCQKTDAELEKRREALTGTYQVVRIVRAGDNATVIPLRAEGKRPVGAEQATACRTCGDFGACVSAVPDTLGKTYTDVCFNQSCNDQKAESWRRLQQPTEPVPASTPTGVSEKASTKAASAPAPESGKAPAPKAQASSLRNAIKEYREQIWRQVFHRGTLKLGVMQNRALLIGILAHRSSYLDGSKAMDAINKALATEVPIHASSTSKQLRALLAYDQDKLAVAFQHMAAHVTADMPIRDIEGYLNALEVKLEDHWKVNETFFDILTKTELDAVCAEIGLADAAGKHYATARNGNKKDFITAMLKVEGFNYVGAIPRMMRWDPKV
jgi:ParB family transcriptional regulator, chromosome partitioning protein